MSADAPSLLTPVPAGPLPVIPPPRARGPVEITIDGQSITVPEGTTLLEACRSMGIDTPTLCYLENLTPVLVETSEFEKSGGSVFCMKAFLE